MRSLIHSFLTEEGGQDLIEYTLLLAFVCLVAATIFINAGQSASGIWVLANTKLVSASTAAGS